MKSRESSHLEFKKSFSPGSVGRYGKTVAAFANAGGGYLAFGVSNSPHVLEGLKDARFEQFDPDQLTRFLNEHFSPEIRWEKHLHELGGKTFGLIYVFESRGKPVICTRNSNPDRDEKSGLKEGEIYYRYRGRSECIKYPELRRIIDEHRRSEQMLWMQLLRKIARIGVQNAGIFDVSSGEVSGASGTFVIDESLLGQLAFIREGEFVERDGIPSLKLVGSVKAVDSSVLPPVRRVVETRAIRGPEIIKDFLSDQKVSNPCEYIRQICHESSAFLPIYHYIRQAKLGLRDTLSLIEVVITTQPTKARLINRLTNDKSLSLNIPVSSQPGPSRKRDYLEKLRSGTLSSGDVPVEDLRHALQAIRMLDRKQLRAPYLRSLLWEWFATHYGRHEGRLAQGIEDDLRRAVCFLDAALNRDYVARH